MTRAMIEQLLELQRRGVEPYFTNEGWIEFFRLMMAAEEENEVEASA